MGTVQNKTTRMTKFKIGQKVRTDTIDEPEITNKIGTIEEIHPTSDYPYKVQLPKEARLIEFAEYELESYDSPISELFEELTKNEQV